MKGGGWIERRYAYDGEFLGPPEKYRPLLPVNIRTNKEHCLNDINVLVDSGAEDTILDADLAPDLDVPLIETNFKLLSGLGGKVKGYRAYISLQVRDLPDFEELEVFFVKDLAIAGILGKNFFSKFDVCFERSRGIFSVRETESEE